MVDGEIDSLRDEVFIGFAGIGAIRTKQWHYFARILQGPRVPLPERGPQLYDLAADPGETVNVIERRRDIADDLHRRLAERFGVKEQ